MRFRTRTGSAGCELQIYDGDSRELDLDLAVI